ncbi:MAG: endonuclease III domain-containing protein [Candidatus Micrarchaeia archaeon]
MAIQKVKLLDSHDAQEVINKLESIYKQAKYFLRFDNNVNLLVGAIIEARTKDEVVIKITSELFKNYHTAKDYALAKPDEILKYIRQATFAGNKAKSIIEACKIIEEKYGGKVPSKMEELTALPGIGRKTANTILINGFGIVEGMPIDTWAMRVSYRLGLTDKKTPDGVEEDLKAIVPKKFWANFSYVLKAHGKEVCNIIPQCTKCPLSNVCPKNGV